jgi:hypothetical protein
VQVAAECGHTIGHALQTATFGLGSPDAIVAHLDPHGAVGDAATAQKTSAEDDWRATRVAARRSAACSSASRRPRPGSLCSNGRGDQRRGFGEAVLDAIGQRLAIPPEGRHHAPHAAVDDDRGARARADAIRACCIGDRAGSSA